jgi:hypothetical protein
MLPAEHDVLHQRHAGEGSWNLEGAAEPAADARMRRRAFDGDIVEEYATGGRDLFASQKIEERRLACAVRADQADDLIAAYGERNIVDGGDAAKALRQALREKNVARTLPVRADQRAGIRHPWRRRAIHAVTRIASPRFDC